MMKGKLVLLAAAAASIILASCASSPGPDSGSMEPVTASVLTLPQIRAQFGPMFADNPFIFASGALVPTTVDYIVLEIVINAKESTHVLVTETDAVDSSGKMVADYYTRETFGKVAAMSSTQVQNQGPRQGKIDWYYLPSRSFDVKPGQHKYIVVLAGTHPLPDNVQAIVHVTLGDEQEKDFTIPVPPIK